MAYFKIKRGLKAALPSTYIEGNVYVTTDEGKIYIDTSNTSAGRIVINAKQADFLGTLSEAAIRSLIAAKLDADVIPIPTVEDASKFLIVNDAGKYEIAQVFAQDIMGTVPVLNENYPADTNFVIKNDVASPTVLAIHITEQGSPATYTYQWYKNGEFIAGATENTYTLPSDLGNGTYTYYCEITNVAGTVKSKESIVTVNRYYTPVLNNSYPANASKTVVRGNSISNTFEVKIATAGVPAEYTYQWYKDNSAISGATSSTYTATESNVQADSAHTYYCKVTNTAGSVNSRSATFNVTHYYTPTLNANYPADVSKTVISGNTTSAAFEVKIASAGKPESYTYQWYENDVAISGATSATYTKTGLAETGTYKYYCKVTNSGGTVQSRSATLSVTKYYKPVLNASYPADVTTSVIKGNSTSATFEVKIATAGVPASYTYQWYVNDQAVAGETNATFTKTGLSTTANYSVYCMVTNTAGSVKSRVSTLKVTQYYTPILNSSYPADATLTVIKGNTVSNTFKVEVATAGVPASYTYQWYVNNAAVSGATSATYTKSDFATTATYSVYCKVTNSAGSVNSRTSTVKVTQYYTPTLNSSLPANATVITAPGGTQGFSVGISTAGVPASYSYQWYVNNAAISGATSSSYSHSTATVGTFNIYCKVTNSAGSVNSRTAVLTVKAATPAINTNFTYSGGAANAVVRDEGNGNWNISFLSSGTFTPGNDFPTTKIDIFCVGGGAGGGHCGSIDVDWARYAGIGGGAGYTATFTNVSIAKGTGYSVVVGAGGAAASWSAGGGYGDNHVGSNGSQSYFMNTTYSAQGGQGGSYSTSHVRSKGGPGGSGGGGGDNGSQGAGGSNGGNGGGGYGGAGQGTTTNAFGSSSYPRFAGGGGSVTGGNTGAAGGYGPGWWVENGISGGGGNAATRSASYGYASTPLANTGGGGGGGWSKSSERGYPSAGAAGIVIIRNAR